MGYQAKPYESTGRIIGNDGTPRKDSSANIYLSMLLSPAWQRLTVKQQQLYLYCKAQLYAEHPKPTTEKHPTGNERFFTMNRSKYVGYGLYKDNNRAAFQRDIEALIQNGFITCVEHIYQKSTVYAFSNNWQKDDFKPTVDDMTYSMTKKLRNKRI